MRSPIVAMLWEQWRLTRVEAAWRLGLGIVGGSAAILLFDAATDAFWIVLTVNAFMWFSIAKLNGGRFMDGYKPGFPFYLYYTRPMSTIAFVSVTVLYDAISGVLLYLVTAALLGFAFDQPLPLFSVAAWILTARLAYTCVQWSTPNRVVQWVGSAAFGIPMLLALQDHRVASSLQFEFPMSAIATTILVGAAAFGLTVAGVARQRRGDSVAIAPQPTGSGGYPDWLLNLFRFPCPTSSPTRAQVWFELKCSGLPVLSIGLSMAVLVFLLYAMGIVFGPLRPAAVAAPVMFGIPILLFLLGGNAFGVRRKQGRTYLSAFEATQPYATSKQASIKVLVRSGCVLAALIAVGFSIWASSSLMNAWDGWFPDGNAIDARPGLLKARQNIGDSFGAMPAFALVAQVVILFAFVAWLVASFATFSALRMRYPRQVLIVCALVLLFGLAIVLLAFAVQAGLVPASLVNAILSATKWALTAALLAATTYLIWNGLSERALTTSYLGGTLLISAAFGAAWVTLVNLTGGQFTAWALWPALLPLIAGVLAPWSLGRIRHL